MTPLRCMKATTAQQRKTTHSDNDLADNAAALSTADQLTISTVCAVWLRNTFSAASAIRRIFHLAQHEKIRMKMPDNDSFGRIRTHANKVSDSCT